MPTRSDTPAVHGNRRESAASAGRERTTVAEAGRIRLAFCLIAAAMTAAALLTSAGSLLQDGDTFWHVTAGLDMLSSLTLPTTDTYSHTFAGHPWFAKEWLGQILLALGYLAGGWNGVVLLTVAAITVNVFVLAWYLSADLKPLVAVGAALLCAALLAPVGHARPFIFSFPIAVIWTAELFRASRREEAPPLWLLALMCLWANLHAGFTLGFVIAFFAGLDVLERTRLSKPKLLGSWILFGLLCPIASLLHPYGLKAILSTFAVIHGNESVPLIAEWQPFNAQVDQFHEIVLLAAIFALVVSPLRIGWARAGFLVFSLHFFLSYTRFTYLPFLLVPTVLAFDIATQIPQLSRRNWAMQQHDGLERLLATHFNGFRNVLIAAGLIAAAGFATIPTVAPSPKASAEDALAFARKAGLTGNVLNTYSLGGTLIFHGIETFIDGRNDQLFQDGFATKEHESGLTPGKPVLKELIDAYDIEWALLTSDDSRIPFFDEMENWKRLYADENAVIYAPRD